MKNEPHPIDVEVGLRIKTSRKLRKMTQTDLAKAVGVTYQQIQKYEKGGNRVSASMLHAIASALGIQVSLLLTGDEENHAPPIMSGAEIRLIGKLQQLDNPKRDLLVAGLHRIVDSVASEAHG